MLTVRIVQTMKNNSCTANKINCLRMLNEGVGDEVERLETKTHGPTTIYRKYLAVDYIPKGWRVNNETFPKTRKSERVKPCKLYDW